MNEPSVIVDTSVWIRFFHNPNSPERQEVDRLLAEGHVVMVGVVLAELLQGARSDQDRDQLETVFSAPPFQEATKETWMRAGRIAFHLRRSGVALPLSDILIGALAQEGRHEVYTRDHHFESIPDLALHGGTV